MTLFRLFRRGATAPVARERLQLLLAHERETRNQPDLLGVLREEILAVIAGTCRSSPTRCRSSSIAARSVSTLEVDIEIPNGFGAALAKAS